MALSKRLHHKDNSYLKVIRSIIYSFTVASFNFEQSYHESNSNSSSNSSKTVMTSLFNILIPTIQVSGYMSKFIQHSYLNTKR